MQMAHIDGIHNVEIPLDAAITVSSIKLLVCYFCLVSTKRKIAVRCRDPLLVSKTRRRNLWVCPLPTALLSNKHGNLEALNACLGHARERGAERFGFLGDTVG
jgi:hypothetical protein